MTILTFLSSKSPIGQLGAGKRSLRSRIIWLRGGYLSIGQRFLSVLARTSLFSRGISSCGGCAALALPSGAPACLCPLSTRHREVQA